MARIITSDKEIVEGTELAVNGPDSKVLEFPLSDGSTLAIRVTLRRVVRASKRYNDVGEPLYNADIGQDIRIKNIPDEFSISPEFAKAKKLKSGPEVG